MQENVFCQCEVKLGGKDNRDLKIYDAAAQRRGFITKGIFIEDKSHE